MKRQLIKVESFEGLDIYVDRDKHREKMLRQQLQGDTTEDEASEGINKLMSVKPKTAQNLSLDD